MVYYRNQKGFLQNKILAIFLTLIIILDIVPNLNKITLLLLLFNIIINRFYYEVSIKKA